MLWGGGWGGGGVIHLLVTSSSCGILVSISYCFSLLRVVFVGLLSSLVHLKAFSLAIFGFCLAIVVSVFVLFSIL